MAEKVYIGSYGARKDGRLLDPIECEDDAAQWLDASLKKAVNDSNRASWAQGQLRILADMLDDRAMDWAANEARRIADGLGAGG